MWDVKESGKTVYDSDSKTSPKKKKVKLYMRNVTSRREEEGIKGAVWGF
jgi:hypothetical protein